MKSPAAIVPKLLSKYNSSF